MRTSVSNSPGLTARPVTAMRVACTSAPNFSPPDSATARKVASVVASSNGSSERKASANARTCCARPGAFKCLSTADWSYASTVPRNGTS